jgi:hypothetical protein
VEAIAGLGEELGVGHVVPGQSCAATDADGDVQAVMLLMEDEQI